MTSVFWFYIVLLYFGNPSYLVAESIDTLYVVKGQNVTLPCPGVESDGAVLMIEWYKGEQKLVQLTYEETVVVEMESHLALQARTYALLFFNVKYVDSGSYTCVVNSNRMDDSIDLLVQDVPEAPEGRPISLKSTSRTVNLSWEEPRRPRNSPVLYYIIHQRSMERNQWNREILGDWELENPNKTFSNKTSWLITGLNPYSVYAFRVTAVNKIGPSPSGLSSYPLTTLKEAPSGRPNITDTYNTSSSSVVVEWYPPPNSTHNAPLRGYILTYQRRGFTDKEKVVRADNINYGKNVLRISNLRVFTQYIVSLQVYNSEGSGPKTAVSVMTGQGAPSAPRDLHVVSMTHESVSLEWSVPDPPNGIIMSYNVYCVDTSNNLTKTHELHYARQKMDFTLTNLLTFHVYKVWVTALTKTLEGNPSKIIEFKTDVKGPDAPEINNVTCYSTDSLYIQWLQPKIFFNEIDAYYVHFRSEYSLYFDEIEVPVNQSHPDNSILIQNLTENVLYIINVQAASNSIFDENKEYRGKESDTKKIILRDKCWTLSKEAYTDNGVSAGIVAGIIFASFCLLLSILSFVLWRKYFQASYYYLDDPPFNGIVKKVTGETYDSECDAIPVSLFPKHVMDLHADGDIGFSREYESLIKSSSDIQLSSEQSQAADNKNKNRYINILAYDHSRVLLKPLPGQKKGPDYINANYIDGYNQHRAYIGTQGPMPATFGDYWRMIWEQRVYIIVMITNLVERGRKKCDLYWPTEGSETYGIIQVKLLDEVVMATYIIRTISIKNLHVRRKKIAERVIYQYHYTDWQDHGVPEHPLPVMSFIKKSAAANPENAGPIIVHCSAGVGRTGTYIVLDTMLKQIKYRNSVNVKGFLNHIRQQRNYLVQTEEQYIFLHDALVEAIESSETDINANYLSRYIQSLQTAAQPNSDKGWVLLEKQFKLVSAFQPKDYHMLSASKPCNKSKNRNMSYITVESSKVHITPKPGVDGSDYINASFVQGFSRTREFIITQHPLKETTAEFWQMVWDHNVHMMVLLSSLDEPEFDRFWPVDEDEMDFGNFKLTLNEESMCHGGNSGSYTMREFSLSSSQDDFKLKTKMFHHPKWPETCSPMSSVFELINIVQTQFEPLIDQGPLLVIDRYGGPEAATFCSLTSLNKQLECENHVDVYQNAKLCHIRRPGVWKSQDDFLFLYRAMESIVTTNSNPSSLSSTPTPPPDIDNALNGHILTNNKTKLSKNERNTSFV